MKTIDFIMQIQAKFGGKIDYRSQMIPNSKDSGFPRLLIDFQGFHLRFEIQNKTELYINVYQKPPHLMKIYHENFMTKLLDKISLHSEVKIGDPDFDDKYVIEFTKLKIAQKTINSEFKECIINLEPFKLFQMKKRDYIMIKDISNAYNLSNAESDIWNMIKLVKVCSRIWGDQCLI